MDKKGSEHKKKTHSKKKRDFKGEIKKNPWILSTAIIVIALLVVLSTGFSFSHVSKKKASDNFMDFAKAQGDSELEYVSSKDYSSDLYEVNILSEGSLIPVYVTKDGKYFVQVVSPISGDSIQNDNQEVPQEQQPEPQEQPSSYSDEDLEKISEAIECFADEGVKIYGANWCGYTKSFLEGIGGFEVASPIYVECTEEEELCSQEGVTGYPTTKIDGEPYSGARTFEGLAEATGCEAPAL